MAIRYSNPKVQYFYANGASFGEPLVDGFVYFYDSGTLNLKNTYANSGLSIVNPNPMRLDGAGRINAPFLDGNYRVVLEDKDGVQQFEIDPVQGSLAGGQWEDWDITTTYSDSDLVRGSDNFYYKSISNNNLGNNPVSSSANWSQILFIVQWNENETYALNDNVIQNGTQYKSLQDDNINNPPDSSPSFWGVPTGGLVAGNPVSLLVNDVPYLDANNNLSDVVDASTSRANLGLGTAATVDTGTAAGEVPLNSDLGTAAYVDTGTGAGDVPLNSQLGTAAARDVGTGSTQLPQTSQADARYLGIGAKAADSNLLDALDSTFFRNAGNLNAGTVADARLPSAATNDKGIVQLSTSVSSTSTTLAATPSAVKAAYDLAASKLSAVPTGFNTVGTYIMGGDTVDRSAGSTIAGSGIWAAGFVSNGTSSSSAFYPSGTASVSGTWRAMGTTSGADTGGNNGYTLYVRIA